MDVTRGARRALLVERVRSSLWIVPGLLVVCAVALAYAVFELDRVFGARLSGLGWLITTSAEGARATLTAIAGSVMSVAGISFSITVVVLQLASTQFSPRVVRGFLRDRTIQVVLGIYLGTFVYVLLVLRTIRVTPGGVVPALSLGLAVALGVACMVVIVVFVHHVAHSVQISTIVRGIARETRAAIEDLYPSARHGPVDEDACAPSGAGNAGLLVAPTDGYLEYVDEDALGALPAPLLVCVDVRVGEYVRKGEVLGRFWPAGAGGSGLGHAILRAFSFYHERTIRQDVAFGFQMIVDVALRALSPTLNDPTTAVHCVEVLGDLLARFARRAVPQATRDLGGDRRLFRPHASFGELVKISFEQITIHGRTDPRVAIAILEALAGLAEIDGRGRHAAILLELGEHVGAHLSHEWLRSSREEASARIEALRRRLEGAAG